MVSRSTYRGHLGNHGNSQEMENLGNYLLIKTWLNWNYDIIYSMNVIGPKYWNIIKIKALVLANVYQLMTICLSKPASQSVNEAINQWFFRLETKPYHTYWRGDYKFTIHSTGLR